MHIASRSTLDVKRIHPDAEGARPEKMVSSDPKKHALGHRNLHAGVSRLQANIVPCSCLQFSRVAVHSAWVKAAASLGRSAPVLLQITRTI
jgi:hypothetical protein